MADIVSAIPLQPAVPPAGPAPTGATATGAALGIAAAAPLAAGGSAADFLGQLTAALKTLAGAVTALPAAAPQAAPVSAAATTMDGVASLEPVPLPDDAQPKPLKSSDDAAELLAAFGLIAPPPALPAQAPLSAPAEVTSSPVGSAPAAATAPPAGSAPAAATSTAVGCVPAGAEVPTPTPAPQVATSPGNTASAAPPTSSDAPAPPSHAASHPAPAADTPATRPQAPVPQPPQASVAPETTSAKPIDPHDPHKADSQSTAAPTAAPTAVAPQAPQVPAVAADLASHQPGQAPRPAPHAAPPLVVATAFQPQPSTDHGTSFGDNHPDRQGREHRADADHVAEMADPVSTHESSVLSELTGRLPNAVGAPAVSVPPNVHPAEVASQIAHQADLFRLPGNRGVRIQLHPEELGGVQVTLLYAPRGGGLELHINVEHAATGALVQAGWSQLRDALATQGISPDRLVMSVTGPHNANQLDFSSNGSGSGYRPDQGLATFTQSGQSGQQRSGGDPNDGRGGPRVWSSTTDSASPSSSSDEAQGSAASSSRIDYRV